MAVPDHGTHGWRVARRHVACIPRGTGTNVCARSEWVTALGSCTVARLRSASSAGFSGVMCSAFPVGLQANCGGDGARCTTWEHSEASARMRAHHPARIQRMLGRAVSRIDAASRITLRSDHAWPCSLPGGGVSATGTNGRWDWQLSWHEAQPDASRGVVRVRVEQADRLPRAQRKASADHRHGQRR